MLLVQMSDKLFKHFIKNITEKFKWTDEINVFISHNVMMKSIHAEILLITLLVATMKRKCLNVAIKYFYL